MREAWTAWKWATRFAFWTLIETITAAISARKKAALELTAFNPQKPVDMFAAGYAIFYYDISFDSWGGVWRSPDTQPGLYQYPQFIVYQSTDWNSIPWHRITFKELEYDKREFRAVALSYARKHLKQSEHLRTAA